MWSTLIDETLESTTVPDASFDIEAALVLSR
jgi:hypothetical protein